MSALDKIVAHQDQYSCRVETLGECRIALHQPHHRIQGET